MKKLYDLDYNGVKTLRFIEQCNAEELYDYKQSSQWKRIVECEDETKIILPRSIKEEAMAKSNDIKIGIITALPKECAAVKKVLKNAEKCFLREKAQVIDFL